MISPELAAFLHGGVSIHIATRSGNLEPHGARVAAVAIDPDGTHVTAYVPKVAAAPIVADLKANRQAAICFVRPHDDRACQLKGEFLGAGPAAARERTTIERQWKAFVADLAQIGFARQATEGWKTWPAIAVRLRVTALFNQTPGPGAGAPIP
jgi:hypothetical protein